MVLKAWLRHRITGLHFLTENEFRAAFGMTDFS